MSRATKASGRLQILEKCLIITPYDDGNGGKVTIYFRTMPEISDSKAAAYQSEVIPGRSNPVPIYSHSEARTITSDFTFITATCDDIRENTINLRLLKSLVYPGPAANGAPYTPPPICRFLCGHQLDDTGVCVVLKSYSVKFPTDVPIDMETYLPYKFTMSCQWEVVYNCSSLPTNQMIATLSTSWICPAGAIDEF